MSEILIFIEQNLRILYLIHIPAGFASMILVSIIGFLVFINFKDNRKSLARRGKITLQLWMTYCAFMFIVIPTASILATISDNTFLLYMALFLLYLNLQLLMALLGKQTALFNRTTIVIGLIVSYVIIGRGLLYAIQQQPVPATIVFFGVMLAIITTIDLTTISHANRIGLIIRNGIGTTLAATTAMINIYVFRGDLAWISWIIPTLVLTPVIASTMFINNLYAKKNLKPPSIFGQRLLHNILAFKSTLEIQ